MLPRWMPYFWGCDMEVRFRNEQGKVVTKFFDSPYLGMKFVQKLKRSKRAQLLGYTTPSGY